MPNYVSPRERALDACLWALVLLIRNGREIDQDGYLLRRADELLLAGIPPEERAEECEELRARLERHAGAEMSK